ncbi:MAG: TRAP transporter large permease subunit, partial [Geminicoccaceae bacterium]|nr:TRAP transporter large permease subunit [Geminicoccaceae bacterium]
FIEIAVVVVPIVAPILLLDPAANVTAVWLGVMIGLNIQTSFLTPPFGFALFYLRGVAPAIVRTVQIYKGVIPFILLQLTALAIAGWFPALVNYLPGRIALSSETAPPPINPRLQLCIEEMLFDAYRRDRADYTAAIDELAGLDRSMLPDEERRALEQSLEQARAVFALADAADAARIAAEDEARTYRPLHAEVSAVERASRRVARRIAELDQARARTRDDEARIARLTERIEAATAERDALEAQIPAEWPERHAAYLTLARAENAARQRYRRTADEAYTALADLRRRIDQADAVAALAHAIEALQPLVRADAGAAIPAIEQVMDEVGALDGTSAIRQALSTARRALRDDADTERASREIAGALEEQRTEAQWRTAAARTLAEPLARYEASIRDTIGLRQQPRLNDELAARIALCTAHHRDISLNF